MNDPFATGPIPLGELGQRLVDRTTELAWLQRADAAGVPLGPMVVIPEHVEAEYYRWNNLPERIVALFADLDPHDPDEEDVEERAPHVAAWIMEHALLDGVIDHVYASLEGLPADLQVRRPGALGVRAARGRPALLAIKRAWAADWSWPAVMERCRERGDWLPSPRPTLVHDASMQPDQELAAAAAAALGRPVNAWSDGAGRLLRLALASDA